MCGIFLSLSAAHHVCPTDRTKELLRRRGPDSFRDLKQQTSNVYLTCFSTVLALRGHHTVAQPVQHPSYPDAFLCWNGEAWKLNSSPLSGNDSEQVFSLLSNAFHSSSASKSAVQVVQKTLTAITGPYAFAYFDPKSKTLFFGRDPLGRRSLMYRFDQEGNFILSTISDSTETGWQEVEADGIYCVHLPQFLENCVKKENTLPNFLPYLNSPNVVTSPISSDSPNPPPLTTNSRSVVRFEELLRQSLQLRISNIPHHPNTESTLPSANLAVLFSGGLDCTLLACLAHDILDITQPIDLINVAFQNPRVHRRPADHPADMPFSPYELCPDRITGRASFAELMRVCPDRSWRFLAVDVPYEETLAHRSEVISLISPHNTEMDLSIACALYFASRGKGLLSLVDAEAPVPYTTNARVLLSGLGADELFGGYTRHATAFNRRGFPGLVEELDLDVGRLGKRNLGRDDRVLSNWARETRFPFLDEELVRWAVNAPVWERCDFGARSQDGQSTDNDADGSVSLEHGKKVLRCLAWKLGMKNVAGEAKRAIQFGARTAKMEAGRTKGTHAIS